MLTTFQINLSSPLVTEQTDRGMPVSSEYEPAESPTDMRHPTSVHLMYRAAGAGREEGRGLVRGALFRT